MWSKPLARRFPHPSPRLWRKQERGAPRAGAPHPDPAEGSGKTRFRTLVLRSIHEVDAARWNAIVGPAAVVRSHAYLAAVEASKLNDCTYFYPVIEDERGQIAAHACVYTITTDFAQLLPRPLRGLCERLRRRRWPRLLRVKITECASPFVVGHSISLRAGPDAPPLLRMIGEAVADIARSQGSPLVVVRDFTTAERAQFDALRGLGYEIVSNMPLARIRVRWESYAEYLAAMRARYRKDVLRRLRRAAGDGQRIRELVEFGQHAELWAAQSHVMYERSQGFKRELLAPAYYENMSRLLGEHSRLLVVERAGRMVAHGMILTDAANTVATYFGRDAGPPGNEWFHLLNEVIRIGIERKSEFINLGFGSYDAKSIVGADVEPLHVYSKSRWAPINWLMKVARHAMAGPVRTPKQIFRD